MALTDSSTPQSSEKARVNLTAKALSFFYNIVKRTPWYAAISYPHFSFFFLSILAPLSEVSFSNLALWTVRLGPGCLVEFSAMGLGTTNRETEKCKASAASYKLLRTFVCPF